MASPFLNLALRLATALVVTASLAGCIIVPEHHRPPPPEYRPPPPPAYGPPPGYYR